MADGSRQRAVAARALPFQIASSPNHGRCEPCRHTAIIRSLPPPSLPPPSLPPPCLPPPPLPPPCCFPPQPLLTCGRCCEAPAPQRARARGRGCWTASTPRRARWTRRGPA
eukprot:1109813-Prymnesium_polylepis.1